MKNEIDVHNLLLDEAIIVITKAIKLSYENNYTVLSVIHGFNHGVKIKNWCRKEAILSPFVSDVKEGENEGISKIYIKLNISKLN